VAKRKNSEDMTGSTFADLYDIQQEMNREGGRPMGRPRKKIQRKPTTIYLTKEEATLLRRLHVQLNENLSLNRSEIVGIAVELLTELLSEKAGDDSFLKNVYSAEEVKRRLKETLQL
jgi:hypothetical protein